MIQLRSLRVFASLALVLGSVSCGAAQQDSGAELSDNEKQAMQQITLPRITATISFLASDELGGRDTPSKGLDVASAYVASRFQGAGLEGLGTDGSFYQSTEIATIQVPETASVVVDGKPVSVLGVLSADNEPFAYDGEVFAITEDTPRDQEFTGPVKMVAEDFGDRRAASNFSRQLIRLRQGGATAVLVEVPEGHPLVQQAQRTSEPRMVRSRGGFSGPVILVPTGSIQGNVAVNMERQVTGKATVKNVIGMIKGSDPQLANEAVIFTAHLDHIGKVGTVGDTINNGADDDATGVTAVLSLADAYSALQTPPKRTVIFMTFWGEEKGLLGSRHYVNEPAWPLENTVANINLEMLGRPEAGAREKTWMTGWDQSDLGKLMNDGAQRVGVLVFEHPNFSSMLYRASDNYSFVEKGVIAHSFSAGSLHDDYHKPTDEWEKLELKHMHRVIEGLFAGSLPIAQGSVTPRKAEVRRQ